MTTALGLLAGLFTTVAWVPQIVHSWQRRTVMGISWGYLSTIGIGVLLWLLYGVSTESLPLIAANSVSEALVLLLVAMKAHLLWSDLVPTVDDTALTDREREAVVD